MSYYKLTVSDADIEDNLESDTSRCFSKLSLETSMTELSPSSQENMGVDPTGNQGVDVSMSSSNTDTLTSETSGTSTSTIKHDVNGGVQEKTTTQNHSEHGDLLNNGDLNSKEDLASKEHLKSKGDLTMKKDLGCTARVLNGHSENPMSETVCCLTNGRENSDLENRECIEDCSSIGAECNIGIPKVKHISNNDSEACDRTYCDNVDSLTQNGVHQIKSDINSELKKSHSRNSSASEMTTKLGNMILEDSTPVSNRDDCHKENGVHDSVCGGSNCEKGSTNTPPQQHSKHEKEIKKEALVRSKVTLGLRYHTTSRECTIMSCIHQFTSAELLTGNNKFGCAKCTQMKYKQGLSKGK